MNRRRSPLDRLAEHLRAAGIGVVGVQTVRHPGLRCGDAVTLTAEGARRFAGRLGLVPGGPADSEVSGEVGPADLLRACARHGVEGLTVAVEYGNVRLGEVTDDHAVALMNALTRAAG